MDQPDKTATKVPPARGSNGSQETLKTVLVSDLPDSVTHAVEPSRLLTSPTLTTASLSALSQRYDILSEAGHGNMGNVYKARDRETGETVALKLIKPEIASDQGMMERFKNELLFARKITHKNVCRVYDFNRIGGIAYTSMEYVEGESLRSVLNRFGGLPLRKGIDLALQICSGLKEAHAQGIVHRDLKPENVMIDAQGNLKIMDFGIARSMEAATHLTGAMVGTPAYMAPEQVAGKPVDYRTDIYSLGLMLYEMFTGAQTFHADTPVAVALKQMREEPVAPHEIDPAIPVFIERAILKCLQKDPARRYQSAAELQTALRSPTGTGYPTAALAPSAAASLRTSRSTDATVVVPATLLPAVPKSKRTSPIVWLLLGALAVFATLAGLNALAKMKSANLIAPPSLPAQMSAPAVPGSASPTPTANTRPGGTTGTDTRAAAPHRAKASASANAQPSVPVVFPHVEFGKKASRLNRPGASAPVYLWIGRFEREDRAQAAAKRIEDNGLPTVVMPRRNPQNHQQFFVVFTGPFAPTRAQDIVQRLQEQGFSNVREVRPPGQYQKQNQPR
ncbi:MAG TPA: serine/threonine-protein kinase [Candidatus Acidoferrales bacterium]|nr:serine/threonine-protein kinase [Candidatus Acidoferrales bacterium]